MTRTVRRPPGRPGLSHEEYPRSTAGDSYTCASLTDGTVRCWGPNDEGQLGTGEPLVWLVPTPVPLF